MVKKTPKQVQILVDDDSPAKRYRKGDVGTIVRTRRDLSDSHPKHHLVKLDKRAHLDGKPLSSMTYFNKNEVEEIDDDW